MRWSLRVLIEKVCPTRKLPAASMKQVALSSTRSSSAPSSPSRKQNCPPSSPPRALPLPPPCSHPTRSPAIETGHKVFTLGELPYFPLYFSCLFCPFLCR